jgi:hypothetical protein
MQKIYILYEENAFCKDMHFLINTIICLLSLKIANKKCIG